MNNPSATTPYFGQKTRIHEPRSNARGRRLDILKSLLAEPTGPLDPVRIVQSKMAEVYFGESRESPHTRKRVANFLYRAVGHLAGAKPKTVTRKKRFTK